MGYIGTVRRAADTWPEAIEADLASSNGFRSLNRSTICPTPRLGTVLVPPTGELRPVGCRKRTCLACKAAEAWGLAHAICMACPGYFLTVTDLGEDGLTIARNMGRLFASLRRSYDLEYAYHVEHFRQGGLHCQAWCHGQFVDSDAVETAARALGLGWARSRRSYRVRTPLARPREGRYPAGYWYGFKELLQPDDDELARAYLVNNRGLLHTSHGFWRDSMGRRLATRREAVVCARRTFGWM